MVFRRDDDDVMAEAERVMLPIVKHVSKGAPE